MEETLRHPLFLQGLYRDIWGGNKTGKYRDNGKMEATTCRVIYLMPIMFCFTRPFRHIASAYA